MRQRVIFHFNIKQAVLEEAHHKSIGLQLRNICVFVHTRLLFSRINSYSCASVCEQSEISRNSHFLNTKKCKNLQLILNRSTLEEHLHERAYFDVKKLCTLAQKFEEEITRNFRNDKQETWCKMRKKSEIFKMFSSAMSHLCCFCLPASSNASYNERVSKKSFFLLTILIFFFLSSFFL